MSNTKLLIKILIGAAWIDGKVQPEEREYLQRLAAQHNVADEPDIYPLLHELRAIKPEECYGWVQDYLGEAPSLEHYQQLVEAISGLIYSDGTITTEEARLLTNLQNLDPATGSTEASLPPVLKAIRTIYQRWVSTLNA